MDNDSIELRDMEKPREGLCLAVDMTLNYKSLENISKIKLYLVIAKETCCWYTPGVHDDNM